MKFVNIKDAQARLPELLALLDSNPAEEIVIMRNQDTHILILYFDGDMRCCRNFFRRLRTDSTDTRR